MVVPSGPRKHLETERLQLVAASREHARAAAEYFRREWDHLAPWSPPAAMDMFDLRGQRERMILAERAFDAGAAWRWLLFEKGKPNTMIGQVHFNQIVRGAFQCATLGYGLAKGAEGRGLMYEALRAALEEVFGPRGRLHRVQANALPENTRSLALLERLGFVREGVAKEYLFIDRKWRDHVLTSLTNPDYRDEWR